MILNNIFSCCYWDFVWVELIPSNDVLHVLSCSKRQDRVPVGVCTRDLLVTNLELRCSVVGCGALVVSLFFSCLEIGSYTLKPQLWHFTKKNSLHNSL